VTTSGKKKSDAAAPDPLELVVTWISGALLAGMIAFLVWDSQRESRPPSFETTIESQTQRGTHTYVTVAVRNGGDEAARTVEVRVVPQAEPGIEAHFSLDWVPGRSTRRGVAVFVQGVALGRLRAEVVGYSEP
jgi:uncharacterized protein (TIGR02588 family)